MRATQGGFDHLQTGTAVVVSWDLGFPVIVGILDLVGGAQTALPSPTLTGVEGVGSNDATQPVDGSNNYRPPHAPTDIGGGDWSQMGTLGNHVAVLEGGLSLLGAPSAQVQSFGVTGLLRHVSRILQNVNDFGMWKVENLQGKTSFILRAGANQTTQTGLDEQHWTIRLDLGASGDMLDFRILEPEGKTLFRLHAGSDGRVQIFGDGGVDVSSGAGGLAETRHDIAGARSTTIAGDDTHQTQGDSTRSIDGAHTHSVGGDETRSVGGAGTEFINGNHAHGVGGDQTRVVGGKRKTSIGDDDTTSCDGNITVTAQQTHTTDGVRIKHGANAIEPHIKGTTFGSSVMSQISAAGAAATTAGAVATAAILPDTITSTPTGATVTAVAGLAAALTAIGSLLSAAAAAYPTTQSRKVFTE